MPNPATPNDDRAETSPFFPDVPPELVPKSLDGSRLDGEATRRAHQAVGHLARKMDGIIIEYAEGRVNQAQFQAIYARYCEQRAMVERILENDLESLGWRGVTESGSTSALRRRYAAIAEGILLIEIRAGATLRTLGDFDLPSDLLVPILSTVIERSVRPFEAGAKSTLIEGGRWLTFVPGELTAQIAIFSQEPSGQQLKTLVSLHRDFERANYAALRSGAPDAAKMVYPQEALF